MNAVRFVVLAASFAGLSACTTSQRVVRAAPAAEPRSGEVSFGRNTAYIAQVERAALRRGIEVNWVHPPTRRVVVD